MADLCSGSFHHLLVPCCNFPTKPSDSKRLRLSAPIPFPKRRVGVTHHTHLLPHSTSPSTSSPNSDPEDFHLLSSTECSDGSVLFRFGNASELREKIGELDQEKLAHEGVEEGGKDEGVDRALLSEGVEKLDIGVDHDLGKEIESSSTVVVGVADKNLQLTVNEKESVVFYNESETTVINDSQKIDRHLKLDSVEDGEDGISGEDVAALCNGVPSMSEEDSEVDSHKEVVVSTVPPESDMLSDLNSGASGEVQEKEADEGHGVDVATNNMTDGVDVESSELMPLSTSLEFEQVANDEETTHHIVDDSIDGIDGVTNNLTGGVDTDLSEMMPVSASLESERVANDGETTHHIVDDSTDANKMEKSAILHDLVASSDLENKIDADNNERSDYEDPSHPTVPEINSIETTSHGEKTWRTELFLISGAACLPHPSKALTGREDAYFIACQNWLGVADGVGQWSLEGSNTRLYVKELIEKCEKMVSNYENISTIKPAEVLTRSVAETDSPGSSSALVAHFDGQALHVANVGNTGFIIIRDGSIFRKTTPMFHEFSFPLQIVKGDDPSEIIEGYKIDLSDGDVIITATDGLFDNLYEQEIASFISKSLQASLKPQEIAEFLAMKAQEVGTSSSTRSPFADAAQAAGYVGYTGGKLDGVTVIVSLVRSG